ncbi:MAG: T9SS type A sorting domain-containing protein [Saprospiraceae bacterium]|nr:T9SS type A sorting domain-containing protein [Saprospiraceae bacterium]MBK9042716.1 T9SS type A sorting domain-containing protein [Saprospiraceae bacterium]MBP6693622.1 T9SS type A sorting domain-containing protein [Saprospiraceae bacterium]
MSQSTINSLGSHTESNGYSFSYSLGELGTKTMNHPSQVFFATSGILQPDPMTIVFSLDPERKKISLFPNPASNYIDFSGDFPVPLHYQIFSVDNQLIKEGEWENKPVSVEILLSGFYMVRIFNTKTSFSTSIKFIKI